MSDMWVYINDELLWTASLEGDRKGIHIIHPEKRQSKTRFLPLKEWMLVFEETEYWPPNCKVKKKDILRIEFR